MNNNKKKIVASGSILICLLIIIIGMSYSLFSESVVGEKKYSIVSGNLGVVIDETKTLTDVLQDNSKPMSDTDGKNLEGYKFSIVNNEETALSYSLYIVEDEVQNRTPSNDFKYYLTRDFSNKRDLEYLDTIDSREKKLIDQTVIPAKTTYGYNLKLWIASTAGNEILGTSYACHIEVEATQNFDDEYAVSDLNGNDPVLQNPLVPVNISDTGIVTKADINGEWYDYENNIWANAVILNDETKDFEIDEIIPESDIESYFVWIPKFDYQIFNDGNYTALGTLTDATQEINIRFSSKNTENNDTECAYPLNETNTQARPGEGFEVCSVGKWMTHPAFITMDVKGFWVGKFETGYLGATTVATAQINSVDTSKIIIKPNVFSWRNITVGNIFKNSYDYKRELDSHAMKNIEWGAMAYLSASKYGYKDNISTDVKNISARTNNNSGYVTGYSAIDEPTKGYGSSQDGNRYETKTPNLDGTYTINYLNPDSQLASTTGNYSGIFDTAGGANEYVMGYTTAVTTGASSGILTLYPNFFSDKNYDRYWDRYTATAATNFNNRILGDATGEMGPFQNIKDADGTSRPKLSWNSDTSYFITSTYTWFERGMLYNWGMGTGTNAFYYNKGENRADSSYRIVLSPKGV